MKEFMRATVLIFLTLILALVIPVHSSALAKGEKSELQAESDRLSYELLQLRSRRNTADREGESLRGELANLDANIAEAQAAVEGLENDIKTIQDSYDASMRNLYKMGNMTELEILLGAKELEDAWQDHAVYERLMAQDGSKMEDLKGKLADIESRKRDLRDQREKRARIAETLDTVGLDARISQLEGQLSQVDDKLHAEAIVRGDTGSGGKQPRSGNVPPAGDLQDRIQDPPSIADFEPTGVVMAGYTTWYGEEFEGRPTASGAPFHMYDYTCAHKTLPFGTWLLVSFKGRQVVVQVNDRGPFVPSRVLDLSFGAAHSIGLDGVQWTECEVVVPKGR
jgi:peptidoglycan hydrolase CwlO-like protein